MITGLTTYNPSPDGTHYPTSPLQPTIEAILHTNPSFNTRSVDILACSLTFEHLLRYFMHADPDHSDGSAHPFRILVQAIGNTAFFLPRETEPRDLVPDQKLKGYGARFAEWCTAWGEGVTGSMSHQRVLDYEVGGLRCVVRFEADGYFGDEEMLGTGGFEGQKAADERLTTLSGYGAGDGERLFIVDGGADVPQEALFDIETHSAFEAGQSLGSDYQRMARLWVRQVSSCLVGFHHGGCFNRVQVQDVREEILDWQTARADKIGELTEFLKEVAAAARKKSGQILELSYSPGRGLQLEAVTNASPLLPEKLATRWAEDHHLMWMSEELRFHDDEESAFR